MEMKKSKYQSWAEVVVYLLLSLVLLSSFLGLPI